MPIKRYHATLHGGAKPRLVEIREGENRGGGFEGTIFYVDVISKTKAGKEKTTKFVEKVFHREMNDQLNFGNPMGQFATVQDLSRLNNKKKLGLRLPKTVRLRMREDGSPSLIISRLNAVDVRKLSKERRFEFVSDLNRQLKIADANGYHLGSDVFRPVMDKKSGMVVAVISDFGNVRKSFLS